MTEEGAAKAAQGVFWILWAYAFHLIIVNLATQSFNGREDYLWLMALSAPLVWITVKKVLPAALADRSKAVRRFILYMVAEVAVVMAVIYLLSFALGGMQLEPEKAYWGLFDVSNMEHVLLVVLAQLFAACACYVLEWGRENQNRSERHEKRAESLEDQLEKFRHQGIWAQKGTHLLNSLLSVFYDKLTAAPNQALHTLDDILDIVEYYARIRHDVSLPLKAELMQAKSLVRVFGLKYGYDPRVAFREKGRLSRMKVIPMLLLLLSENILRYAVTNDRRCPAVISLTEKDGDLTIIVRNRVHAAGMYRPGTGQGMDFLESRLEQFYPGRYTLAYHMEDGYYHLYLHIVQAG